MASKRKQDDSLAALLETVSKTKLIELLVRVSSTRPAVRRECLDYLNRHTTLSPSRKKLAEGKKLLALWAELAPDLDELDAYGGGDYDADIHVSGLLQEIAQALSRKKVDVLGDVLETLRFRGSIFFRSQLAAPWGMQLEATPAPRFHIALDGDCVLGAGGENALVRLKHMDIVLLP